MKRKAYCSMILIFSVLLFFSPSFSADKPKTGKASAPAKKTEKQEIKRVDTMIAVFDLETTEGVSKSVSRPLSESIRLEVFKSGKWKLIDRGNMDKVLGEQKFSLSGCVTGQCIVEAGQMLGVGKIVAGSVSIIGKTYYLSLSLINASTGQIEAQSEDKCKCEIDELIDSSKRLINKLLDETPSPQTTETASIPSEKEPELKEAKEPAIEFSLEEFEKKAKEETKKKQSDKAKQNKKTEQMKLAYKKVEEYEQKDISPELKANAWKYFAEKFKEDNPYSTEDDKMRQKAKQQAEYYISMAKQPPQSPLTKGESKDPTTGLEMVFVKGGCYQMGDTFGDGYDNEKPVHEVCLDDFYMGKYEVTQGQWKQIMGNNPSYFKDCGDNCPVEGVSWNDIQEFIQKLNNKTGKNYKLPTEAEWEYAARSGGKNEKYSGGNDVDSVAWYNKNSGNKTHPVGQKKPNGLGIYDMSGNVWEWVSDWYDGDYYKNSPKNNPTGPNSGTFRVLRGGSWRGYDTRFLVPADRGSSYPGSRSSDLGFRLVRTQ